jgi:hypothetical protein
MGVTCLNGNSEFNSFSQFQANKNSNLKIGCVSSNQDIREYD